MKPQYQQERSYSCMLASNILFAYKNCAFLDLHRISAMQCRYGKSWGAIAFLVFQGIYPQALERNLALL